MEFIAATALTDVVGVLGALIFLGAYAAVQLGLLRGQSYGYAALNALGAIFVLFSLSSDFNLSSAMLQISWITISVVGMVRLYIISARIRFTEEESRFLASKMPTLSKHLGRRLLDSAFWVDGAPGTVLTREGEPVEELVYLLRGEASVSLGDKLVGYCTEDSYIGELTCMNADPATATVTVSKPSRYLCVSSETLRRLAARNSELARALEDSFAGDVRKKLVTANRSRIGAAPVEGART